MLVNEAVWKYDVEMRDSFSIRMPRGAQVLSVQMQRGIPCVWALVDTDALIEPRRFNVVGTGNPCHVATKQFVGTWQDGDLVWHLFVERERR